MSTESTEKAKKDEMAHAYIAFPQEKDKTKREIKIRLSLRELELPKNKQKKEDFLKALIIVKALPAENPDSYWAIASYHGMPYIQRQVEPRQIPRNAENDAAWNGYCQHANILFPTWHRFYCLRLEQSLQNALPEGDVMLPYWDQTSHLNLEEGLPPLLYHPHVLIDNVKTPNPLLSFTLPQPIPAPDDENNADLRAQFYVKPSGYTTKRYPFSGIVHPDQAREITDNHNENIENPTEALQENLHVWLTQGRPGNPRLCNSILAEYQNSLNLTSYNLFSNTKSAGCKPCLEQAHNDIHLAVGGFTTPRLDGDAGGLDDDGNLQFAGLMSGANGDMGANETAAFDPIFFIHHCNVDRMFWVWQKRTGNTATIQLDDKEDDDEDDEGLTNVGQGPTPHQTANEVLNFQTALHPFTDVQDNKFVSSADCFDIINQLGYDYSMGSLDHDFPPEQGLPPADQEDQPEQGGASAPKRPKRPPMHNYIKIKGISSWTEFLNVELGKAMSKGKGHAVVSVSPTAEMLRVSTNRFCRDPSYPTDPNSFMIEGGAVFRLKAYLIVKDLNMNDIAGSFVVYAFYKESDELQFIGQRGVLSRWDRKVCGNCMRRTHSTVSFSLDAIWPGQYRENMIWPCTMDINKFVCYVVSKDPSAEKPVQRKITAQSAASENFKPTFQITVTSEQFD